MELIDIGVNLTNKSLQSDLDGVMRRALDAGVEQMIVTGQRAIVIFRRQLQNVAVSELGVRRIADPGKAGMRARDR